ncbi:MAG TPA: arginine--tRNA ligase [Candidatus Onthovivens sp.]|nr:arginine--tRNA ligase [Candidatus Onthovivens sp.]
MANLSEKLVSIIKEVLTNKYQFNDLNNLTMIEIPKDNSFGDYSTNIAMRLVKVLGKNPQVIANELKEELEKNPLIEKVVVAGPGFINLFLARDEITTVIKKIIKEDENYGRSDLGNNEKIMVEYVSANPTGDLHLGHARGAAYGDTLTRILKFCGYDCLREYYVNDAGNQIKVLGDSLFERYKEALGLPFDLEKIGYQGKDIKDLALKLIEEDGNKYLDLKEEERNDFFQRTGSKLELDKIKVDLDLYRVGFDHYQSELDLYRKGKVENVLKELKASPLTYEKDGALWLKTTEFGDDMDRVLIKSDKTLTYLAPDLAYHKDKFDRGYSALIDLFGADHHGYLVRLRAGLEVLGYDSKKLDFLIVQIVRLMEDGKEVKMSKRTGNAVTIRELCEDVGVDVARYFFISRPIDSHLDFDLNLARKQSNDNPVYYIQYAYARMNSILNKYSQYSLLETYPLLNSDKEIDLIKHLDDFKNTIEEISKSKEVNKLANYNYKLAQLFHSYYNASLIIDLENIELTKQRIALIKAVMIVIRNGLNLLGIEAREKM